MKTQGGFLITQIKQIGGRIFEKILDDSGIREFNGAQGKILYVLWEHNGIAIAEISRLTGLANTTLTSMLDRMEKNGLIQRVAHPKDRRKTLIYLTERAAGLKEKYFDVSEEMNQIYYRGFQEDEIIDFEQKLERVLNNLKGVIYDEQNSGTDIK
ncbi:MAG: MarR family transcriptional regulator [Lachnospiraceae bacterium]|nr:MarR family transcriptional regulator [Lachnospiraceae bacterium]